MHSLPRDSRLHLRVDLNPDGAVGIGHFEVADHPANSVEHNNTRETMTPVQRYRKLVDFDLDAFSINVITEGLDRLWNFQGTGDPHAHVSQESSDKRSKGSFRLIAIYTNSHKCEYYHTFGRYDPCWKMDYQFYFSGYVA
jgi:hypothetical protein